MKKFILLIFLFSQTALGIDSFQGRTGVVSAATNDYTWARVNKNISSLSDLATKASTNLSDASNLVLLNAANLFSVGQQQITVGTNSDVGLVIRAPASPSTNLLALTNSAGTVLAGVSSAFKWTGDGSLLTGADTAPPNCTVSLDTPNGYGSTNNKIRRFTNIVGSCSDLTVAQSATNGDSVTIVTTGTYSATFCDNSGGTGFNMGMSLNTSEPTTVVYLIIKANRLAVAAVPAGGANCIHVLMPMVANDVLRAHNDAGGTAGTAAFSGLRVSRVY